MKYSLFVLILFFLPSSYGLLTPEQQLYMKLEGLYSVEGTYVYQKLVKNRKTGVLEPKTFHKKVEVFDRLSLMRANQGMVAAMSKSETGQVFIHMGQLALQIVSETVVEISGTGIGQKGMKGEFRLVMDVASGDYEGTFFDAPATGVKALSGTRQTNVLDGLSRNNKRRFLRGDLSQPPTNVDGVFYGKNIYGSYDGRFIIRSYSDGSLSSAVLVSDQFQGPFDVREQSQDVQYDQASGVLVMTRAVHSFSGGGSGNGFGSPILMKITLLYQENNGDPYWQGFRMSTRGKTNSFRLKRLFDLVEPTNL